MTPYDPPYDPRATTADHLAKMNSAVRAAGITPDEPLGPVIAEWQRGLAWAGELTARIGETSEALDAKLSAAVAGMREAASAQQPIDPAVVERLEMAAASGAAARAAELASAHNTRNIVATCAGLMVTVAVSMGTGYLLGRQAQTVAVTSTEAGIQAAFRGGPEDAAGWLTLMQSNNLKSMLAPCTGKAVQVVEGRRGCGVGMWLDPARNAAPALATAGR